jgi:hypothetical protein
MVTALNCMCNVCIGNTLGVLEANRVTNYRLLGWTGTHFVKLACEHASAALGLRVYCEISLDDTYRDELVPHPPSSTHTRTLSLTRSHSHALSHR